GRMLVYYAYVNQARAELITAVRETLARLTRLGKSIREERARLDTLLADRQAVRDKLAATLASRKQALAALENTIASREDRLAKLRRDEKNLAALVRQLQNAFADIPDDLGKGQGFDTQRGGLDWPIDGNIVHRFGDSRPGGMQWQGVMINAGRGDKVQAVARGRVAYADWLPHYGMLVIIEHGNGYMSLYGHNQALYTQAGDWVQQGETIATVGDTGGREQPGLYFEIRKNGDPVNPVGWLERH
ncbi:MAG TPA: peptidoglycan DD-metalloendopeptidase family protein, partial [Gammaproteobacteria bacterium]|nr:peptidoglycan DD-metalloendopeptidase family protein [Gammaproteobacteria bacterium]